MVWIDDIGADVCCAADSGVHQICIDFRGREKMKTQCIPAHCPVLSMTVIYIIFQWAAVFACWPFGLALLNCNAKMGGLKRAYEPPD